MIDVSEDITTVLESMGRMLRESLRDVAVVELGTGGLLAYLLSSHPASADIFRRGFVCNDQRSLLEEVCVQRLTIEQNGLLSESVAKEAARGARFNADCTYGISVAGNPGPGTVEGVKPGSVWIALSHGTTFSVVHHEIHGSRQEVQWQTVVSALMLLSEGIRYW